MFDFLFNGGFMFILIIAGIAVFLNFVPLALWISAIAAGVNVGIFNLVGMRFRRVPASQIVLPLIKANKAGLDVNVNQLEAHYLAGGNVDRVIDALIAAHRAQIPLSFERSCAIDLAGRNVLEAVQMSVNPEVIETPVVSAVAKDGIELKVKARVTVRANIDRLVGGAGEATIIARVGEGTGNESLYPGNAGEGRRSPGQGTDCVGRCFGKRPFRRDGLLPHEQYQC